MTYVASPKTPKGSAERSSDCFQCVTATLSTIGPAGSLPANEASLISAAVEAGWEEEEVRTAIKEARSVSADGSGNIGGITGRLSGSSATEIANAPLDAGRESAKGMHESAKQEERRIEERKGSPLLKGEERFEERSRSSDGKSAGEKQDPND